ncbi:MAG: hypothetical protein F6J95_015695 [Leptolyngbya sp. SIO1E4]|nr:hypothetical protein [Leptolyngbya sp. SIO1E4]
MGLIKKIFGGIFALIGGVLGGIAKLLGFGKKGDFYIEADESSASEPALTANNGTSQAVAVPAQAQKAPAAANNNGASAPAQPQVMSPTLAPDKPLVTPKSPAELQAAATPQLTNFATDFLVNPKLNGAPRRRPGPSVSPFKDMAKQMGKKSASMG